MYKYIILCLFFVGCSAKPFSIIPSTAPLPEYVQGDIPTEGVDCQYRLLGLLPVTGPPNTQSALQEAKNVADADVLTDVTVDETYSYFILFSNNCVYVRGLGVARVVTDRLRRASITHRSTRTILSDR